MIAIEVPHFLAIILSMLPIICLLVLLMFVKLPVPKAGGISLLVALGIAILFFGLGWMGLLVAIGKALAFALFVSLIVWFAIFLYQLIRDFKAIDVINKNIELFIKDEFVRFMFLAWLVTGLFQGMAGFGVPVVIVGPILIALGYDKVKSVAAALLGHSWAVTFGSLGAAFYVMNMLTGVPYHEMGMPMWVFNTIAHLLTGFGVAFLHSGVKGMVRGISYILPVSAFMAVVQFITIWFELYPLATINTALLGMLAMYFLYRLRSKEKREGGLYKDKLNFFQAILPYVVILALAITFQFAIPPAVNDAASHGWNFPQTETAHGYVVEAQTGQATLRVFRHPGTLLLAAAIVAAIIYKRAGIWNKETFQLSLNETWKKGKPATLALLAVGNMSLVMMESGMTSTLAEAVASATGGVYTLVSPLMGILASFLTGNNTNSNLLFGAFQYNVAVYLIEYGVEGINGAIMAAAQSLGGSVGVAIGPTLVLMGCLAAGIDSKTLGSGKGMESVILKKLLVILIIIGVVMGVANFIMQNLGFAPPIPSPPYYYGYYYGYYPD